MNINKLVEEIINKRRENSGFKSRSLIVTLFGDYVSVFSRSVQLSTIVNLMGLFGLNEPLIRTTVNRLLKSGWVSYIKDGRNSLYSITKDGDHRFDLFSKRIYQRKTTKFENEWTILLVDDCSSILLQKLRRQLLWLGYSPINSRSFVHPGATATEANELIRDLELEEKVIVGSLCLKDQQSKDLILNQAQGKLPLDTINKSYQTFIDTYNEIWNNQAEIKKLTELNSFMLRLLMIHDYRRILLRDPDLPAQSLPANWRGEKAQKLLKDVYSLVNEPSTRYFAQAIGYDGQHLQEAIVRANDRFAPADA